MTRAARGELAAHEGGDVDRAKAEQALGWQRRPTTETIVAPEA